MPRHFGCVAALIGAALGLPVATPAAAWSGSTVCESHGYRRNFCRVDTEGRVRLVREISTGNLCRQGQGRGWWFDNRGIWVDRGCRGVFEFGRGRSGPPNNNSNAAIAAGIGALLGAAMAGSSGPPPPPPAAHMPVPSWAVGSFQAWDPQAQQILQLVIQDNGGTTLRNETGGVVNSGLLRDGMVFWNNGRRSWIAREDPGVMLGDVETGTHFNFRRS
jgi:hypothetical protein